MKDKLKSFFTQHWTYMAVSTACKLNLFDHLQEQKTAKQLATELSMNEEKLLLLLNALHNADFLRKNDEFFKVNPFSEFLIENNPESLKYACLNWSAEHLTAWQNLDFSIKTGKSSFEKIYEKPFFDFLNDNPEKLHAYHKAMYQYAKDDYKTLSDVIDFSKHKSVMDVGGGYGAVLENIKAKNPSVECILFDLEKVVVKLTIPNIKKSSGSFFNKIPNQSEAIILSRILHDWNDEKTSIILKNCFGALPNNGTLYVIENCSDKIKIDLSLLSLNMTTMCESYERTSTQYISLCENVGFCFASETKLNELQTILIFKKKMNWKDMRVSDDNTHFLFEGKQIFGKTFIEVLKFHSPGFAPVLDISGAYHIDISGNELYPNRYSRTFGFYCNRAAVVEKKHWFHINEKGKRVYSNNYSWTGNYQENICTVRNADNQYFHIDLNGNRIYEQNYVYAGDYKNGIACVKSQDGLYRHIDNKGSFINDRSFLDLGIFHKNFATAKDKNGWFHIDNQGNELYNTRYLAIEPFYNGFALVTTFENVKILIDEKGLKILTV